MIPINMCFLSFPCEKPKASFDTEVNDTYYLDFSVFFCFFLAAGDVSVTEEYAAAIVL